MVVFNNITIAICFNVLFAIMTTVGIIGLSKNSDPIVLYGFLACTGVVGMMFVTFICIMDFFTERMERRRKRVLQTANPLLIV